MNYIEIILELPQDATDDEIRTHAQKHGWNNSYIYKICKCGRYWTNIGEKVTEAKIINKCKGCFEEE